MAKKRILIVDDEPQICQLVKDLLEESGYTATTAHSTDEAFQKLRVTLPDMILLDVRLPTIGGLEFCRQLKQDVRTKKIPIIMLTVQDTETDKVIGLEVGADDYLTKPFGNRELLARIKAVFRRLESHRLEGESIMKIGPMDIDLEMHEVKNKGKDVLLTPKEFELLVTLAKNKNKALRREALMSAVWGYDYPGTLGTIDVHIRHLRKKLGNAGRYIKTLIGVGYRLDDKL
ncbi:MAG: response regulator transcription factor [Elusimicrobia bacterium]|nr:response regulator transcription factor [Candidatus Obscuribacterium magneticum]